MANTVSLSESDLQTVIQDTQRSIEVNVFGSLKTTLAFLDLIRQGELKKVVAISSGMGDTSKLSTWLFRGIGTDNPPGMINEIKLSNAVPYAISKGALNVLVAKLSASYSDQGILFMALCPGRVDTSEGIMPECESSCQV